MLLSGSGLNRQLPFDAAAAHTSSVRRCSSL